MAAFDFPSSPSVNQTYTANGVTWKWNGTMWMRVSGAGYLEKIEEGNSKVEVDDSGTGTVTVTTDGTEKVRITSAGNVGIGTDDPSWGVSTGLIVGDGASAKGITIFSNSANVGDLAFADATSGTARYRGLIRYDHSNDSLALRTNSSERLRIISSGEVSIGGFTPTAGDGILQISGGLRIAGSASASDTISPYIYRTSGYDHLNIATNGVERLRITNAGRMGLGTNNPAGKLHISSGDSGDCVVIIEADTDNNDESDIPKILFRQDGGNDWSAIGNGINSGGGVGNNALVLANSVGDTNGGISFQTGSSSGYTTASERLRITQAGEVQISNGNLKFSTSGTGIDFSATSNSSGTMSSELLDDYEEGSWTPTFTFGGNSTGLTYSSRGGLYTRVGRLVTCYCIIVLSNKGSSTGNVLITGLPYTATDLVAGTAIEGGGHAVYQDNTVGTHVGPIQATVINNQSYFELYRVTSTSPGHSDSVTNGNVANNSSYRFVLQYTAV